MKLTLVLSLFLAACTPLQPTVSAPVESRADGVRFSVERVSPGVFRLMLDNGAPHPIGYNLCTSVLQRRTASGWSEAAAEICTMQLDTLNPGADATFEKNQDDLEPGEYRYVTRVESPLGTASAVIATDPFVVR
jgi:hypothetical protein